MPTPRFEASAARLALRAFLPQVPQGEIITYASLSEVVGFDIRSKRSILRGARQDVEASHGIEFDAVTRVGLQRLRAGQRLGKARQQIRRLNRSGRRVENNLLAIPMHQLLEHEQARCMGLKIAMAAITHWSSDPVLQALTVYDAALPTPPRPTPEAIRQMFSGA